MFRVSSTVSVLLLAPVILVGAGCAEVYQGPRVVTLSNDRFDIRYAPPVDTHADIEQLAANVCEQWGGRQARVQGSAQYLPGDLRTVTYTCVAPAGSPGAAPAGAPLPGTAGTPLPGTAGTPLPGTAGPPLPGTAGTPTASSPAGTPNLTPRAQTG